MTQKPTAIVLSSIAIAIIVLVVAGVYAQNPHPVNELDKQVQAEGSKGSEENKAATSKVESSQNQKVQKTILKQNPDRKIFVTDNSGTITITVISTATAREIWSPLSFPGKVKESKIVGEELLITSETGSKNSIVTEFRKIALATGSVTSYIQIPGKIVKILE